MTQHEVEARYTDENAARPVILRSEDDVDLLIYELLTGSPTENLAQLHSRQRPVMPSGDFDHELRIGVDRELGMGVVAFMDADGNVVTVGSLGGRVDPIYWEMGRKREILGCVEIPVESVRQAAKEFLVSGGQRPTCVQWQEEE